MKATGIIKRLDENGRIELPSAVLKKLGFSPASVEGGGTALEIFYYDDGILLQRGYPSCEFCNTGDGAHKIGERFICMACVKQLYELSQKE